MKKFYLILVITFCFGLTNNYAQNDPMQCTPSGLENIWNGQIGGWLLPSVGTIRVLFVFAQFPDDKHDTTNSTWVKGQAPANMQGWVDQSWSTNPTQGSMTHYFNEMSFNKLKFIGKTVSVVTPQTRAWYLANNKKRGDIHTQIIQQLDQTWDFAQFDNWDYEGNYNHINRPDGIVDMVFMVWRNIANDYTINQRDSIFNKLNMGRSADLGLGWPDVLVDNGQRRLKMGVFPSGNTPGGSGASLCDWFIENMFRFCIHEYGHYLQGGNDQHVGHGFWGLLSGWGIKNFIANSFERYRLGWINLNTVPASPDQTIQNATLPDFVTTGVAYRLVGNAATNEYFYIENHQKISFWENNQMFLRSPYGNVENGVYVLRQESAGQDNKFIKCLAADGRWNWTVNQLTPNQWGPGYLLVFKRLGADRVNGYHDLEFIPWYWNNVYQGTAAIHFTENKSGQPVLDVRYSGDGKDAFRLGYNEVWSPFSNPSSQRANKTATPFGFKLNSITNGVYSLDIFVGTSLNAPPSKPTGLIVSANSMYQAVLNWSPNIETDMQYSGKYKIYRGDSPDGNEPTYFGLVATINAYNGTTPVSSWTDGDVYVGFGSAKLYYRITAIDNGNAESTPSLSDWINWDRALQKQSQNNLIENYSLSQNYPNPFNPITNIVYQLPKSGLVQLKVYDLLGSEVTVLVNELKSEGAYSVSFDASYLPSGVYIYSLRVNDFVQNNKMTLLK